MRGSTETLGGRHPITVLLLALLLASSMAAVTVAATLEASAKPLKLFDQESLRRIETTYRGVPFMLSIWSVDCPPCFDELEMLAQLRAAGLKFTLVLIAADGPQQASQASEFLKRFGLAAEDNWIYGSDRKNQLRYSLDSNWYGEMPRSYFYAADGSRQALSGVLSKAFVENWASNNAQPTTRQQK